jgi:hypothetical protein
MSASAVAKSAAPPIPCSARAASREAVFQAIPQRKDAALKDAAGKDEPAAVPVGEGAGGEDERRERDRVRVDHPLEPRQARVETTLDRRQRDVDDRDVDEEHERRRADRHQRPPVGALRCELVGLFADPGHVARRR